MGSGPRALDDCLRPYPVLVPPLARRVHGQSGIFWHVLELLLSFLPVQAAVIPALLESADGGFLVGRGGYQPRDLCVSAPTGSGKTLAFVIPVVQVSMRVQICIWSTTGRVLVAQMVSVSAGLVTSSGLPHPCTGCTSHQGAGPTGMSAVHPEVCIPSVSLISDDLN